MIEDYSWFTSWRPEWAEAYCVTLVSDVTVDELTSSLGATPQDPAPGFDAFYRRAVESYDPGNAVLGVTQVSDRWVLICEVNGFAGVTEQLMRPIAAGRTVVSHFRNINAVYQFTWWRDGLLLVDVDVLFPTQRFGADPDAILEHLHGVGLPLTDAADDVDLCAAGFALAQRLTGIACTPELFEQARYHVATIEMPRG